MVMTHDLDSSCALRRYFSFSAFLIINMFFIPIFRSALAFLSRVSLGISDFSWWTLYPHSSTWTRTIPVFNGY